MRSKLGVLFAISMLLTACSKGGELVLEPGARLRAKGSPYVSVNQGGRALLVTQGQTPDTAIHGWVSVQAVSSGSLSAGDGHKVILNKSAAYQ